MLRTRGQARPVAFQGLPRPGRRLWPYSTRVNSDTEKNPHDNHLPSTPPSSTASTYAGLVPEQTRKESSPPSIAVEVLRSRLRDLCILASTSVRQHTDQLSKKANMTFSHLGSHLNRVTGYEEIEALKKRVVEQESRIKATRQAGREAKTAYDDALVQRSISQRQVNDLLQRKSSWTDADVSNFTSLVRSDHSFEQEEARAKARVAETEDAVDREFSELMRVILARYHEEQVWSDKIRSASTYGSLVVLGVNVVVFIMAIIIVEPWKRKRLAQTFEKKVEEMGAEMRALVNAGATRIEERLAGQEKQLAQLITQVSAESRHDVSVERITSDEAFAEETPVPAPPSSWWSHVYISYPHVGIIGGRELMLVAGSAAVGGVMTLVTRSLFAN